MQSYRGGYRETETQRYRDTVIPKIRRYRYAEGTLKGLFQDGGLIQ